MNAASDRDSGGVGTGAGEGATGRDTGTAWVTRSTDYPEAPAQAHLPGRYAPWRGIRCRHEECAEFGICLVGPPVPDLDADPAAYRKAAGNA